MGEPTLTRQPAGLNSRPTLEHETADGVCQLAAAVALGAPEMSPHYRISFGGADGPTGSWFWIIVSAHGQEVWNGDGDNPQKIARNFLNNAVLDGVWE